MFFNNTEMQKIEFKKCNKLDLDHKRSTDPKYL